MHRSSFDYSLSELLPNPALERTANKCFCWLPSSLRSSAAAQRERLNRGVRPPTPLF
jgi:hypothetical protein